MGLRNIAALSNKIAFQTSAHDLCVAVRDWAQAFGRFCARWFLTKSHALTVRRRSEGRTKFSVFQCLVVFQVPMGSTGQRPETEA